jgi:hypothetical protein
MRHQSHYSWLPFNQLQSSGGRSGMQWFFFQTRGMLNLPLPFQPCRMTTTTWDEVNISNVCWTLWRWLCKWSSKAYSQCFTNGTISDNSAQICTCAICSDSFQGLVNYAEFHLFIKFSRVIKSNESEISRTGSTHEKDGKCVQILSRKTWREQTTSETWA